MTEATVQQIVAKAIAQTDIESWKYYHVCWWEGRLQCLHVHHTKEVHPTFYGASGYVFADGLTAHQWRLVTSRIMEFCRTRGIKLREPSKRRGGEKAGLPAKKSLQITEFDSRRLRALLTTARSPDSSANAGLDELQRLLETADTVAPTEVPADVVTMNSRVQLRDDEGNGEMTLALVFPADAFRDADFQEINVSVLTPIGLSILGRRVGDVIEGRIRVDRLLYQPEAAGDFDL